MAQQSTLPEWFWRRLLELIRQRWPNAHPAELGGVNRAIDLAAQELARRGYAPALVEQIVSAFLAGLPGDRDPQDVPPDDVVTQNIEESLDELAKAPDPYVYLMQHGQSAGDAEADTPDDQNLAAAWPCD